MQLTLTLAVADLQQTADFYADILHQSPAWKETGPGMAHFLFLQCQQTGIVFRQLDDLEAEHPTLLQNLIRHPLGVGVQLEFACPDLSSIRRNLERHRWPVSYELDDEEHQRREIWLHDPDGYLLVLNEER